MHYRNGREACSGDHVITKDYNGTVVAGVIHSLRAPDTTCNCDVSVLIPGGTYQFTCQNVGNMYHAEDAFKCIDEVTAAVKADLAKADLAAQAAQQTT